MRQTARRWLRQAEADLKAARSSCAAGSYEWACFQAHQAGEKSLKAFLYNKGRRSVMTHSLKELVAECRKLESSFGAVGDEARFLDMFYMSARYPDSLVGDLAPADYYEKRDAERCLSSSESILTISKSFLKD